MLASCVVKRFLLLSMAFLIINANIYAFGVDVCFNNPASGVAILRNCIDVKQPCRTSHLTEKQALSCSGEAVMDSLEGLLGLNAIVGGRSLLHSDSTYLMAQLIGFNAWQAYQMMMYSEATDQSKYTAFDQKGLPLLTNDEAELCRHDWGNGMPDKCLIITPKMNGIYKFNSHTGGMLLHLHARSSSSDSPPPAIPFPANYLSTGDANDSLLTNFRAWVFDQRENACAAGITNHGLCEQSTHVLRSSMRIVEFAKWATHFVTRLGPLIIHERESGNVLASNHSFQAYIAPQEVIFAKMGIFVHALADRYSHHMCIDRSYFYQESTGNYNSYYSPDYCAQEHHFLWHVWEQGTVQSNKNLNPKFQTMGPALDGVYDQLVAYAEYQGIPVNKTINKKILINQSVDVLGIYDPQERLNQMVKLMEAYKILSLPGHGMAAHYSIEQWLKLAGAPVRQ